VLARSRPVRQADECAYSSGFFLLMNMRIHQAAAGHAVQFLRATPART
jgi:hypothetical protein